jgi:hypothetical protein
LTRDTLVGLVTPEEFASFHLDAIAEHATTPEEVGFSADDIRELAMDLATPPAIGPAVTVIASEDGVRFDAGSMARHLCWLLGIPDSGEGSDEDCPC